MDMTTAVKAHRVREPDALKLREVAYEEIIRLMLDGALRPGQFLSQRQLVAMTGQPLGAIREIVSRLESEGLLNTVPQRGIQIAYVDVNLIQEAFQFRLFLEKEAVALFTLSVSDDELKEIRRQHDEILALALARPLTAEEEERAQIVDWQLHNRFMESLGNGIIERAYRVNSVRTRLIQQERFRISGRVVSAMGEHIKVLDAIQAREPERAVAALAEHINKARSLALGLS